MQVAPTEYDERRSRSALSAMVTVGVAGGRDSRHSRGGGGTTDTQIFYVTRDYSRGLWPVRFSEELPDDMKGLLDRDHFTQSLAELNAIYAQPEADNCGLWAESTLACLTGHLAFSICCGCCLRSRYEQALMRGAHVIERQNLNVWNPHGLHMLDPAKTGLRVIPVLATSPTTAANAVVTTEPLSLPNPGDPRYKQRRDNSKGYPQLHKKKI